MNGPSLHLSWDELACRDGTPYPHVWRDTRLPPLVDAFEDVRTACGGTPMRIISAYRTAEYNRAIPPSQGGPGARHSQHVEGRALDVRAPAGMGVEELWHIIRAIARLDGVIRGVGYYPDEGFVHMDVRESNRLVGWRG